MHLKEAAGKFIGDAEVAVRVKEIHSRTVYTTGNVPKSGAYPLSPNLRVLQLIAVAGGFLEYADTKDVLVSALQELLGLKLEPETETASRSEHAF